MDAMLAPPTDPAMTGMEPPPEPPGDTQFYTMLLRLQEEMEGEWDREHAPVYPPWYDEKDYPKPDPGRVLEKARILEADFAPLRTRIANDWAVVGMETAGVFKSDKKKIDDVWYDGGIAGEIELRVAHFADLNPAFDAPARTRAEEDESGRKIEFAQFCMMEAERQHGWTASGPLRVEKARTMEVCGRLAWQVMCNLDADEDESPFMERLVDPSTCMPVFEAGRGLRAMYRSYATTLGDAAAAFNTGEEDLYNKYFSERNSKTGQYQHQRQESDYANVVEYWDRRWRMVFIDNDVVLTAEHKYGRVPFVYKLSGMGMPSYLRDPSMAKNGDVPGFDYTTTISTRDVAAPHKGIGMVTLLRVPHQMREAVLTRMLTALGRSMEPPMGIEMDETVYKKGVPEWSWDRGALNPIRMARHKLVPVPVDPSLPMLQGIMGAAEDSRSRLQLPQVSHGINDKSNVAGYATNVENLAGMTKVVANLRALEDFERECMETRFVLFRDWGHLIRQGRNGTYGELRVPRQDAMPDEDRTFTLTPGDLRRTGVRITVSYAQIPLQMLGPVGQALLILKQAGWMDDIKAMRILGSPNPYKELQRIKMNKILNDEAMIEAEAIEGLVKEDMIPQATWYAMRKMERSLTPPPGALPTGAEGGMMGAPGGVGTTVGDSNAAYGQGPMQQQPFMPPTDPYGVQ